MEIKRYYVGSKEQKFFEAELHSFIHRAKASGLTAGLGASVAVCMAGYILAAYFPENTLELGVSALSDVLRFKTVLAIEDSARDRAEGLLPEWKA